MFRYNIVYLRIRHGISTLAACMDDEIRVHRVCFLITASNVRYGVLTTLCWRFKLWRRL